MQTGSGAVVLHVSKLCVFYGISQSEPRPHNHSCFLVLATANSFGPLLTQAACQSLNGCRQSRTALLGVEPDDDHSQQF